MSRTNKKDAFSQNSRVTDFREASPKNNGQKRKGETNVLMPEWYHRG